MDKPIQLKIENTKNDIIKFINNECATNEIDYYFLEIIIKNIYDEIIIKKNKELEDLEKQYSISIDNVKIDEE